MVTKEIFNDLHSTCDPHNSEFWTPKTIHFFKLLLGMDLTFDGELLEGYLETCWEPEVGYWTGWCVNEEHNLYCDRWFVIKGLDDENGEPTYYLIWQSIENGACIYAQTPERVALNEEDEWEFYGE